MGDLTRCVEEGREPPNDSVKRLALLRMLPAKERKELWTNANKLYPTFTDVLNKRNEMVRDDVDARNGFGGMDLDDLGDEAEEWTNTGQTFSGKGPTGEDTLFMLQK